MKNPILILIFFPFLSSVSNDVFPVLIIADFVLFLSANYFHHSLIFFYSSSSSRYKHHKIIENIMRISRLKHFPGCRQREEKGCIETFVKLSNYILRFRQLSLR